MPKFVAISDTHGCHRQLNLPAGDVLLHAGDVCNKGDREQANDFFTWLQEQPFEHKVIIWGNHDFDLQSNECLFPKSTPPGVLCLNETETTIEGIRIFGVPTDAVKSGENWSLVPNDIDILLTHRPARNTLDRSRLRGHQGSRGLQREFARIRPRIHVFGHIHRSYGTIANEHGMSLNASLWRSKDQCLVNEPVVFELEKR